MNRIISVDISTMHVLIEPGVTFSQLRDHLKEFNLRILPDIFSDSDSVIFSYLSLYPFFAMPKFEYNENIVNLEVILPNGEIFKTGSMGSKKGMPLNPYGPGLDFTRIFYGAQGRFGIVSKATVKIKPKPTLQEVITIPFDKYNDFIEFIYDVQRREIGTECLIINKTVLIKYFKLTMVEDLSEWYFVICLEGGKYYPKLKISYEKEALEEIKSAHSIKSVQSSSLSVISHSFLDLFNCTNDFCHKSYDIPLYITLDKFPILFSGVINILREYNEQEVQFGTTIIPIERNRVVYVQLDFFVDLNENKTREKYFKIFNNIAKLALEVGAFIKTPYGPLRESTESQMDENYKELIDEVINIFDPNKIFNPK